MDGDRMRIAILSPWAVSSTAVGGTERFVLDLAQAFKNLNNEVDVYMLSGENHITNGINFINLKIAETDDYIDEYTLAKLFGDFSDASTYEKIGDMLEKLIDVGKYDVIQLNSQLFLRAWKNKKRIFTIHTNPFEYELSFGKGSFDTMLKIMKEEANFNTTFVAPSSHYTKIYEDLTSLTIHTIPHAIDVRRLISNKDKIAILNDMNLSDNLINILLPSRLEPIQKQPMLFMKAFSKVDKEIINKYQVICTGLDKQYEQYAKDIEDFCYENNINLRITRFDSMADAYEIADLIVLPSQSESFGYSALEALSLGIPTILNSIPTYLEIAYRSKNSFTFNNDEKTLKSIIEKVFQTKLERIEQNEEWQRQYDLKLFGERYLNL